MQIVATHALMWAAAAVLMLRDSGGVSEEALDALVTDILSQREAPAKTSKRNDDTVDGMTRKVKHMDVTEQEEEQKEEEKKKKKKDSGVVDVPLPQDPQMADPLATPAQQQQQQQQQQQPCEGRETTSAAFLQDALKGLFRPGRSATSKDQQAQGSHGTLSTRGEAPTQMKEKESSSSNVGTRFRFQNTSLSTMTQGLLKSGRDILNRISKPEEDGAHQGQIGASAAATATAATAAGSAEGEQREQRTLKNRLMMGVSGVLDAALKPQAMYFSGKQRKKKQGD